MATKASKEPDGANPTPAPVAEEVEVVIAVDGHEHEGKEVKKGASLKVHPDRAKWMKDNKLVEV